MQSDRTIALTNPIINPVIDSDTSLFPLSIERKDTLLEIYHRELYW